MFCKRPTIHCYNLPNQLLDFKLLLTECANLAALYKKVTVGFYLDYPSDRDCLQYEQGPEK